MKADAACSNEKELSFAKQVGFYSQEPMMATGHGRIFIVALNVVRNTN